MSDYSIKISSNASDIASDFAGLNASIKETTVQNKASITSWMAMGVALQSFSAVLQGIEQSMALGEKNRAENLAASHKKELKEFEKMWKAKLQLDEEGNNQQISHLDQQYQQGLINLYEYQQEKGRLEEEQKALEEQRALEQAELEEKQRQEKNKQDEKAFNSQKAFNIADVVMNLAKSVMAIWSSYSSLGPFGVAAAAIQTAVVSGIGAAQLATIGSQKFVPAYALGTNYHRGGLALVGEEGPELVNLPQGSAVGTAGETHQFLKELNAQERSVRPVINITVNGMGMNDEQLAQTLAKKVSEVFARSMKGGVLF